MEFELHDHTADLEIRGRGDSLGEAFAAVGNGMAAAMAEDWPDRGDRHELAVAAKDREALLFDYLDELIYRRDVDHVLPVNNRAVVAKTADGLALTGSFQGVPLEGLAAREIKAPTYADMSIRQMDDEWVVATVVDI